MIISLIAAMANRNVIGLHNRMPWHMPADLAWFKRNTLHKPIIMGRKTFESIGRPLPSRHNIVISRHANDAPKDSGVTWVDSLENAFKAAGDVSEVMIIGGGNLFHQALRFADRLYLTQIDSDIDGDTFFPDYHRYHWHCDFSENHPADEANPYPYQFSILQRV